MPDEFHAATDLQVTKALDALTAQFAATASRQRIEELFQDSVAQLRGRSTVESYIPTLAARLTSERLRARGQVDGSIAKDVPEVLFVSLHGAGRAQIAAALARSFAHESLSAHTAGSGEFGELEPNLVTAMHEIGIDVEGAFSRPLTPEVLDAADVIVTMGRSVGAVSIPVDADYRDWRIGDPEGASLDEIRHIRDDIAGRVQSLVDELVAARTPV